MILHFVDADGDPVDVEHSLIVGLRVGTLDRSPNPDVRVTLIFVHGASEPFPVAATYAEVRDSWTQAREATQLSAASSSTATGQPVAAYPGVFPLVAHQYDMPVSHGLPEKGAPS